MDSSGAVSVRGVERSSPEVSVVPLGRRLEIGGARMLLGLPAWAKVMLSGRSPVVIDGLTLDPEIQLLLTARRLRSGVRDLSASTPAEARERMRREILHYATPEPVVGSVHDLTVPGPAGELRARHYAPPSGAASRPLLVYFHGGGFVSGDVDTHDECCRVLCAEADVHVLSAEYRLAPESPFPAAVEDALAVFRWGVDNAWQLGARPAGVAVGGDSAGGNLSAVVSLLARDEGLPAPAAQLLIYPATDRSVVRPSQRHFAEGFVLAAADIAWFDQQYFGARDHLRRDPRISPLLAESLERLCPAVVVTAGFDPLRDEGVAYADALEKAGNRVVRLPFDGFVHGFANMVGVSGASRRALAECAAALRAVLGD